MRIRIRNTAFLSNKSPDLSMIEQRSSCNVSYFLPPFSCQNRIKSLVLAIARLRIRSGSGYRIFLWHRTGLQGTVAGRQAGGYVTIICRKQVMPRMKSKRFLRRNFLFPPPPPHILVLGKLIGKFPFIGAHMIGGGTKAMINMVDQVRYLLISLLHCSERSFYYAFN